MSDTKYVIGVDFGTLSGRAVIVDVSNGKELASAVHEYQDAVIDEYLPGTDIHLENDWALQNPGDYIEVFKHTIPAVLKESGVDPADVIEASKFEDGIARTRYPIDIHSPTGEGTLIQSLPPRTYYEVPYRCLMPKNVENLLIGSICISATHEAHSSLRIMPVVTGIGEAAGIAAAWATQQGISPREIDGTELKTVIFGN